MREPTGGSAWPRGLRGSQASAVWGEADDVVRTAIGRPFLSWYCELSCTASSALFYSSLCWFYIHLGRPQTPALEEARSPLPGRSSIGAPMGRKNSCEQGGAGGGSHLPHHDDWAARMPDTSITDRPEHQLFDCSPPAAPDHEEVVG